jgi:hypothetical protein
MEKENLIGDVDPNNIDDVALVENWSDLGISFPSCFVHNAGKSMVRNWERMVESANRNIALRLKQNGTRAA